MAEQVVVQVRVVPRAKRTGVARRNGQVLVRVGAAPVDGKANAAVCAAVATSLGVRARQVEVVAGHTARDKRLAVSGVDDGRVTTWLRGLPDG